jgi:hypothetical protein
MTHEEQIARLRQLAVQAHDYQLQRDWTDTRLCKEIAHLGSTKTFKRILNPTDALEELTIETQLRNYENAITLIEAKSSKDLPPEPVYEDFRNIKAVLRAVASGLKEESISRFVCVEGENGTGKDSSLITMHKRWPRVIVPVEANELWRDSLAIPLADLINTLGVKRRNEEGEGFRMPMFPAQRYEILVEELRKRKVALAVNEAHSMGPRGLNLFKTLINETPAVIVFFCIPVLLNRLIKTGYEEAAQLFGNRLCQRVRLETPAADEIITYFERRGIRFENTLTANELANRLEEEAPSYGNWAFVKRTARKAVLKGEGKPLGMAALVEFINASQRECVNQQVRQRKAE